MEKMSKRELEEILPDYVLNRLEGELKVRFEAEIVEFPDLIQEIEDAKAVFARFDAMEFRDAMNRGSRNVSVRVMNRMAVQPQSRYAKAFRFLLPSLGVAIIALSFFLYPNYVNIFNKNNSPQRFEIVNIKADDISQLMSDSITSDELAALMPIEQAEMTNRAESLSKYNSEDLDKALGSSINSLIDNNTSAATTTLDATYDPYGHFDNLNEDEFTKIYKELKNEKFPS